MDWNDTGLYDHEQSDLTPYIRSWDEPAGLDVQGDPTSFRDFASDGRVVLDSTGGRFDPQSPNGINPALLTVQHRYRHVVEYDDFPDQVVYEALAQPPILDGEGRTRVAVFQLIGKTQTARLEGVAGNGFPSTEADMDAVLGVVGQLLGGVDRTLLPELRVLLRNFEDLSTQQFIENLALHAAALGFEGPLGQWNFINLDAARDLQDGVITPSLIAIHDDGFETNREPGLVRNFFMNQFHDADFVTTEDFRRSGNVQQLPELGDTPRADRIIVLERTVSGSKPKALHSYGADGTRHASEDVDVASEYASRSGNGVSITATEQEFAILLSTREVDVGRWRHGIRSALGYTATALPASPRGVSRYGDSDYYLIPGTTGGVVRLPKSGGTQHSDQPSYSTTVRTRGASRNMRDLEVVEGGVYVAYDNRIEFYQDDGTYVASKSFTPGISVVFGVAVSPDTIFVLDNQREIRAFNRSTLARDSSKDITLGSSANRFFSMSYTSREPEEDEA